MHRARSLLLRTAGVMIVGCSLAGMSAAPSSAAMDACPGSSMCIWSGQNFGGVLYHWTYGSAQSDVWIGRATSTAGSYWNNRATYVSWISSTPNYQKDGGSQACIPVGNTTYNNQPYLGDVYYQQGATDTLANNIRGVLLSSTRETCSDGTEPLIIICCTPGPGTGTTTATPATETTTTTTP